MLDEYAKARLIDDLMKYPIKSACVQLHDGGLITVNLPEVTCQPQF